MPPAPDLPLDVITPPTELPIPIPPVDPGQPFDGVRVRRQWEPGPCPAGCGSTAPVDSVFLAEAVDLPASIRWQPNPVYPASLRAAGISGRVTLQFTVDTLGRIEPGSVGSVESTQPAFERAAVAAIEASRFSPARIRGRPVRQLVRQTISFRIEP
jgi:TonB family protein